LTNDIWNQYKSGMDFYFNRRYNGITIINDRDACDLYAFICMQIYIERHKIDCL